MKKTIKKILSIFVIFIISLCVIQISVYADEEDDDGEEEEIFGRQCTGLNVDFCTIYTKAVSGSADNVVEKLSNFYNYTPTELYTNFMIGFKSSTLYKPLEVYIQSKSGNKYTVQIGEEDSNDSNFEVGTRSFTYNGLCNKLACPYEESEIEIGTETGQWEVVLIISTDEEPETEWTLSHGYRYCVEFYINEAYSGDYLEGENTGYNSDVYDGENVTVKLDTLLSVVLDFATGVTDTILDIADGVADVYHWVEKFTTNAVGTVVNLILDGIMGIFGDGPQLIINYVQTVVDGTAKDNTFLYVFSDLYSDQQGTLDGTYTYSIGERDKYTNVQEGEDDDADVDVDDDDEDSYMFEDNKIPITSVDIYTMAANKVSFLDVNFLVNDGAGADSSIWLAIRNIVAKVIMACFYIAALILITSLIWYGVKIAINSMNPSGMARDKEGLNRFISGVTMLVGSIVIMAISIYAYQAVGITENISGDSSSQSNEYEFPIRVNVNITAKDWYADWRIGDQEYSFSTTITGYMRFMAQIENPDRCMEKAGYVITYIVLANMNLIIFIIMVVRMLAMWILAPVGPILASLYAITTDQKMMDRFRTWAICYIILGCVQLFFAIAYWIMMETMGFN